jgi:catechol 2,3-dioxygenase-like lactoylglutathione lyase family enzyme
VTASGLVAFHTAIVTPDLQGAIERYRKVLGVELWHFWDRTPPGSPLRVAYGAGAGGTWELIGVASDGDSQFHRHLKAHGESVQHIGFWAPDVKSAVAEALEAGGEIVSGVVDDQGNAVVQVKPGDLDSLQLRNPVFLNAGTGFTIEYFGPGGDQLHRDWFKNDFERMVTPPPW